MLDPDEIVALTSKVQKLDKWNNILNIISVVLLALTFFLGFIANRLSVRLNEAKDKLAIREKQLSDQKIAEANTRTATAQAIAEEARLEQKKLSIESKEVQKALAETQKDLSDAKRKQVEAELALQQKVDEVKKRQEPRVLTKEQKAKIINVLRNSPQGPIQYMLGATDDETYNHINEILNTIKAAGWRIDERDMFAVNTTGYGSAGIRITVKDKNNPPAHAVALARALHNANIDFSIDQNPNIGVGMGQTFPTNTIEFFIGNKPKL
ncbi:hypothetical protein ACO2Q8_08450 [Larkinella sp. VNQ87]|uniref:hypothetical protein n=1 Tax=Larkinella sp. VNQ87 TaxID=3400921 RepID=UPI003C0BACF8